MGLTVLQKGVRDQLFQWELAEKELSELQQKNLGVFKKLEELEEKKSEIRESLKRMLYTNDGPPKSVPIGTKTHTWAVGTLFKVDVSYKKHADYYDPKKLPVETFAIKGVVTEVSKDVCDRLALKDGRVKNAYVPGEWMTPAVSIPRIEREAKAG